MTQTSTQAASPDTPTSRPITGKLGLLVTLMSRPQGADLSDMMEATGWQQHSVRGALAGALKKHRGVQISSEKADGARIYRILTTTLASDAPAATKTRKAKAAKPKPTAAKTKREKVGG
jgi:hypothetical protein